MKERNIFHFLWCSAGFCATWMADWGNCSIEQSLFNIVEVSSIYISEKIINGGGYVIHSGIEIVKFNEQWAEIFQSIKQIFK